MGAARASETFQSKTLSGCSGVDVVAVRRVCVDGIEMQSLSGPKPYLRQSYALLSATNLRARASGCGRRFWSGIEFNALFNTLCLARCAIIMNMRWNIVSNAVRNIFLCLSLPVRQERRPCRRATTHRSPLRAHRCTCPSSSAPIRRRSPPAGCTATGSTRRAISTASMCSPMPSL